MTDPNRKSKPQRSGDMIDIRVKAAQQNPPGNYSQFSGISAGGTGAGSGGGTTTDSGLWLRKSGSASAAGGTVDFDLEDSTAYRAVCGKYSTARTGYSDAADFNLITRSGSAEIAAGNRTRLPSGTDPEYALTVSIASGNIRMTFTNNHASEALSVSVLYSPIPA